MERMLSVGDLKGYKSSQFKDKKLICISIPDTFPNLRVGDEVKLLEGSEFYSWDTLNRESHPDGYRLNNRILFLVVLRKLNLETFYNEY